MRWAAYLLAALLLAVQWPLWFGKGGWLRVWELQRSIAVQQETNAGIAARNAVLSAEVRSLKEGKEAIEERARQELHMTRGDEVLFQLVRPDAERGRETRAAPERPAR